PVDSFRKEQAVQEVVVSPPLTETQLVEPEAESSESEAGNTELEAASIEPETEPASSDAPAKTYFTSETSYHIIVGSFKDAENAQHLKQKLVGEGFEAEVLTGENSYYRVSADHYPLKAEAVSALASIRGQQAYKSAWIISL
ncbi:MAG: SPOR domain-containing protein, partial [Bacteroidales bacterium]|nr:SPOR domain-containing protein [Bacteroidales bacterium]